MKLENEKDTLTVSSSYLRNSVFEHSDLSGLKMNDVNLTGMEIIDANLSDIVIDGAQIGGAYLKNIGMPPEGHPLYDDCKNIIQRPVRFENCDFNHSKITNCNLANVEINECNIAGMKINGILIEDLLKRYNSK
ncbi:pentapeptide repeat-containing protein [Bacillus sp. UNC438CL73TsuS30]|uniref:pentapeptide repeat-containing protein n=1 Tax=Bacillus sp. UNC438CL73TsuS30 TaxID=1340434 RepID=UPI00068B45DF|nr:pentapeptide repeat-containing protein [Bacillus sp. UNC438CL73TsuS30]